MESGGWSEWKVAGGVSGKWRVERVESGGWSGLIDSQQEVCVSCRSIAPGRHGAGLAAGTD